MSPQENGQGFPDYLGDGVYVHFDGFNIVLTSGHEDPAHAANIIFLDPDVVRAFARYADRLTVELHARRAAKNPPSPS